MPEPIEAWWRRRQRSRGAEVPYPVGTYREAWASYPVLVRQYHPEFNGGITLSQIPPAAEVWLQWQCEAGHVFVATPMEQRDRPGRERRRSSWCPVCLDLATGRATRIPRQPRELAPRGGSLRPSPPRARAAPRRVCPQTPDLPAGTPFRSGCAPATASAVEAELRQRLLARLPLEPGFNAVRLARPFFDHLEAWPDLVLAELRVAIEYDSTGRHGLEHVGPCERADRRKDAVLREAGWEVVRIRTGRLPILGAYDVEASGVTERTVSRIIDRLRDIRGPLLVDAYLA